MKLRHDIGYTKNVCADEWQIHRADTTFCAREHNQRAERRITVVGSKAKSIDIPARNNKESTETT